MCAVFTFPMCFLLLLCLLVICSGVYMSAEVRYECGLHGKFEYCIDGIPGCVIGCHCHPGYYFDTDTKICEPNVKLTQEFRRHYYGEHTPVYDVPSIPTNTEANRATISDRTQIPKDTDELGDWLYNQFFKTIENQVISNSNNTKPNNNEKPPTRRSGGEDRPEIGSLKKLRTRKSFGRRKKKKSSKVHGLRRKLLRITEDDSLFDSESGSDSGDSSGSSDSESDSDADGSNENSDGKKAGSGSEGDKEHGHKKVIIFNRRPKPPLPSFIFLPNMDTPYYPPIGLPPPPAMPMYPMVPVPPMGPPMYPFPGFTKCDDGNSTTTITTTTINTSPPTSETIPKIEGKASPIIEETLPKPIPKQEAPGGRTGNERRSKLEKHRRRPIEDDEDDDDEFVLRASEPGKQAKLKRAQRNKLMQKLRNKMKEQRKNTASEDESDLLVNLDDVPNASDAFTSVKKHKFKKPNVESQIPNLKDVDFKYLTELIHRVNHSAPRDQLAPSPVPPPFDLNNKLKELQKLKAQQTRRNFDSFAQVPALVEPEVIMANPDTQSRNFNKPNSDDDYYTNLGRQIASMIRNANSKPEHPFNKEQTQPIPFHSVLNENNYSPGSFWERSVRSPVPQISDVKPNNNYLDESRTLKHSNENNLLNLENEVETYVSSSPPLSLQDLENILKNVAKAQDPIKSKGPHTSPKPSNGTLNVNLLPQYVTEDPINNPENAEILNSVEKAQAYYQLKDSLANPSNFSLNVNLLPKYLRGDNNYRRQFETDNADLLNPMQKARIYFQLKKSLTNPLSSNIRLNVNIPPEYLRSDHAYRRLYDVNNADILSPAEKTQFLFPLKNSRRNPKTSNVSLNAKIPPQYLRGDNTYSRSFDADDPEILSPAEKAQFHYPFQNSPQNPKTSNVSPNAKIPPQYPRVDNTHRRSFDADDSEILNPAEKPQNNVPLQNSLQNPKTSNVSPNAKSQPQYPRVDNAYRRSFDAEVPEILNPAEKPQNVPLQNSPQNPKTSNVSFNYKIPPEYLRGYRGYTYRGSFDAGDPEIWSPAEKTQFNLSLQNALQNPKTSDVSLNAKLPPQYLRSDNTYSRSFDVHDPEILSPAEKAQFNFPPQNSLLNPKTSNVSLNLQNLPEHIRGDNTNRRSFSADSPDMFSSVERAQFNFPLQNFLQNLKTSNVSRNVKIPPEYLRGGNTYKGSFDADNPENLSPAETAQYYFQLPNSFGNPKSSNVNLNVKIFPEYIRDYNPYRNSFGADNGDILRSAEKSVFSFPLQNYLRNQTILNDSLNAKILPEYLKGKNTFKRLFGTINPNILNPIKKAQHYFQLMNPSGNQKPSNDSVDIYVPLEYLRDPKLYDVDNASAINPVENPQYYFQPKNAVSPKSSNNSLNLRMLPMYKGDYTNQRLVGADDTATAKNPMEKPQDYSQLMNSLGNPIPSNDSLNVFMIPKYAREFYPYKKLYDSDNTDSQILTHTPQPDNMFVEPKYTTEQYQSLYLPKYLEAPDKTMFLDMDKNHTPRSRDYLIHNNQHIPIELETEPKSPVQSVRLVQAKIPLQQNNQIQVTDHIRQAPLVGVLLPNANSIKPGTDYLQFLKNMPIVKQLSPQKGEPKVVKQNNLIFSRNKHHYMFETAAYPILTPFTRQTSKKYGNPSYFHHRLHHYEYFD